MQYTQYILQDWYICLKIRYPEISWSITICGIQTTRDTPYFESAFALPGVMVLLQEPSCRNGATAAPQSCFGESQCTTECTAEEYREPWGKSWVFFGCFMVCFLATFKNLSDCSLRSREKQLGISMMPHIQNVWPFPEEDTIHVRLWKETPFRKTGVFFPIFSRRCVSRIINNHQ